MNARRKKPEREPIMSAEDERLLAFEGLVQWTQAVLIQGDRLASDVSEFRESKVRNDPLALRLLCHAIRADQHLFAVAAYKLIEHRKWVTDYGLCDNVDFCEIDSFSADDIKDLRDMREHVIGYFKGHGWYKSRWAVNGNDASGGGASIGGRLDWKRFADAARRLLQALLVEPIPYPATPLDLVPKVPPEGSED